MVLEVLKDRFLFLGVSRLGQGQSTLVTKERSAFVVQGQESIRALESSLMKLFLKLVDQSEHLGVVGKVLRRLCVHFGPCRLGLVAKMGRHGIFFLSFGKEGIRFQNGER